MSGPFCCRRYKIVRVHSLTHLLCHIAHVSSLALLLTILVKMPKNASEFCPKKSSFFCLKTVSQNCLAPVFNLWLTNRVSSSARTFNHSIPGRLGKQISTSSLELPLEIVAHLALLEWAESVRWCCPATNTVSSVCLVATLRKCVYWAGIHWNDEICPYIRTQNSYSHTERPHQKVQPITHLCCTSSSISRQQVTYSDLTPMNEPLWGQNRIFFIYFFAFSNIFSRAAQRAII